MAAFARLRAALEHANISVMTAQSAMQLQRLLQRAAPDLVIIDGISHAQGAIDLCRQVRDNGRVPLAIVLPPEASAQIVEALDAGADECLNLSATPEESVARIRSLLRRASSDAEPAAARHAPMNFASFWIFPAERVLRDRDGLIVDLTAMEYELLLTFCRNPGRLMSREELLASTHAGLAGPISRSVDVHVSRLRQKLERDPQTPELLKTVRLGGYVFVAQVTAG
jgi:two-component system, OmpR family, response regulator